jgi:Ca-activated chloride channel family protein
MARAGWLALCLTLTTLPAGAGDQATGEVKGRLRDGATKLGIGGADCKLDRKATATTDQNGQFGFAGVAPGKHVVRCTKAGYMATRWTVQVKPNQTVTVSASTRASPVTTAKLGSFSGTGGLGSVGHGMGGGGAGHGSIVFKMPSNALQTASNADPGLPPLDREGYRKIDENPYKSAVRDPLSTVSIDVDTASYSNARRFIETSRLPPQDAVQLEEFVNYFDYAYPAPSGPHPFSVTTEVSSAPWNPAHRLVHLGLQGRSIDRTNLPKSNLVFLIDVSGSMQPPNKLPLLKIAFRLLVDNLNPDDRVSIVVYAGAAGLVLPPTPAKERNTLLGAIAELQAGGSTAGGDGIELAYKVAAASFLPGGNNRVILATDGDFNVGVSSDGELVRLIEEKRKTGVFLTVLGFGEGNLQAAKMEQLADRGNGHYAYIDSILEARKVLVQEMGGTLLTIAKDVKLQIEFNPAKVKGYRLLGYENRLLAAEDFNDDKKDAGDLGAGHSVTALYEIIPAGSPEELPGVDRLKYQNPVAAPEGAAGELLTVKVRYQPPSGGASTLLTQAVRDLGTPLAQTSDDYRFAAAVAEVAMLLGDSKHRGDAGFEPAIRLAKGALGADEHGNRYDFVKLMEKASLLTPSAQ